MTFIITFIALVIERFFDWSQCRQWRGFLRYQQWLGMRLARLPGLLVLIITLLLPVWLVASVNHYLIGVSYGLGKLLFGAGVLVYCLGPKNFWAQTYRCISVLHAADPQPEFSVIQQEFGLAATANPQAFHQSFTNALFIAANRRVFAVVFWFIVFGPAGALAYRLLDHCRQDGITTGNAAANVLAYLDWLPSRLLALIFALGGHFTQTIRYWRKHWATLARMNDVLLAECGIAALDIMQTNQLPADGTAEKETIALLDRAFVIGLVVLAIIVLV